MGGSLTLQSYTYCLPHNHLEASCFILGPSPQLVRLQEEVIDGVCDLVKISLLAGVVALCLHLDVGKVGWLATFGEGQTIAIKL